MACEPDRCPGTWGFHGRVRLWRGHPQVAIKGDRGPSPDEPLAGPIVRRRCTSSLRQCHRRASSPGWPLLRRSGYFPSCASGNQDDGPGLPGRVRPRRGRNLRQSPGTLPIVATGFDNVASPYDAPGATGGPDLFIKIEEFHQTMCADLSDDLAAVMAVSQRPLSVGAFTEPATVAGWKSLPSWYMVSEHDNVISPEAERFMAKRMGAEVANVDGSHVAFIARPDVATALILKGVAGE